MSGPLSGAGVARARERGAALVEYALVSLGLYLVLAASITFGRMLLSAQLAQDVARVAARELALAPLPAGSTFEGALADAGVLAAVYDPRFLVIDLDNVPGGDLDAFFATLPTVNRSLRGLMVFQETEIAGTPRRLLHYPGALLEFPASPSGLTVAIPRVETRDADGVETISRLPVLEELRTDPDDPTTGRFAVTAADVESGVVALRINVPFQSSTMTGHLRPAGATAFDSNMSTPISADDASVVQVEAPPSPLANPTPVPGAYSGQFGLGSYEARAVQLRPFRRVVAASAIFRREVFAEQSQP